MDIFVIGMNTVHGVHNTYGVHVEMDFAHPTDVFYSGFGMELWGAPQKWKITPQMTVILAIHPTSRCGKSGRTDGRYDGSPPIL